MQHISLTPQLALPPLTADRLKMRDSKPYIFDTLRSKWLVLTPEEWVRQHFTAMLTDKLGYQASLMANEVGITLNGTSRRCDTVVYDHQLRPWMIVEYKAPSVKITQKVFDQIVRYNMVLQVPYLTVSNGLMHYCCHIDYDKGTYEFLTDIPAYDNA